MVKILYNKINDFLKKKYFNLKKIIIRHNGRKHGTGRYSFANGDVYEGYFANGLRYFFIY